MIFRLLKIHIPYFTAFYFRQLYLKYSFDEVFLVNINVNLINLFETQYYYIFKR